MTPGATGVSTDADAVVTTEATCPLCAIVLSLDDEKPKTGTVRWELLPGFRFKVGRAVSFECSNGHSSVHDPDLLKAFPSRRF
jgi:hypothetical protein